MNPYFFRDTLKKVKKRGRRTPKKKIFRKNRPKVEEKIEKNPILAYERLI